jgi:hypothetical protein
MYLNKWFDKQHIRQLAENREVFAPGAQLSEALQVIIDDDRALLEAVGPYVDQLPGAVREAIRSVTYLALSTEPPTQVTFAWAPGYDAEVTIWHAPNTKQTKGGVTILVKSRYPSDRHPVS